MEGKRINVTLDDERAAKLGALAERAHVADGTLARSLLASAIDQSDPDAATVTEILEGIPGIDEKLARGEADAAAGNVVDLDEI